MTDVNMWPAGTITVDCTSALRGQASEMMINAAMLADGLRGGERLNALSDLNELDNIAQGFFDQYRARDWQRLTQIYGKAHQ